MTVIIRDDDISFFTHPKQLEQIYGRLWEANHPVCLAVIPAQNGNARVAYREGQPIDPSIAIAYRGQDTNFSITENQELCVFLNDLVRQGLVEICLHGYCHGFFEFHSEDEAKITQKLSDGQQLLEATFPQANITTFIAPYDQLSEIAVGKVLNAGYDLSTKSESVKHLIEDVTSYRQYQIGQQNIFTCDEYLWTHRENPETILETSLKRLDDEPLLVLTNHYWTFFYDWSGVIGRCYQHGNN